jgi:hypothetical protein
MDTSLSQENEIEDLRNQARNSGIPRTATIQIDGRWCTVTAKPIGNWPFQRTNIKIVSRTTVNFIYDRRRRIAQGLRSPSNQASKVDQDLAAETAIPQVSDSCPREQVLSVISSKIAGYTRLIPISSMSHHASKIWGFLWNVENFVRQNDLSVDEISKLKQELRSLSSTPIIQYPQRPNYLFSINECDGDPHCHTIAFKAESLEILLETKACSQVGLIRNTLLAATDQSFIAETAIPQVDGSCPREQVLSTISSKIAGYTRPMPISSMSHHTPRIWVFLWNVENFVRQNDLSMDEVSKLRQELRHLSSTPIIQYPQKSNYLLSINECDGDPRCRAIALRAESLEILLDAKACGQVGLERNTPPMVKVLSNGKSNTVYLAHRKPGVGRRKASGPVALKQCNQSKSDSKPTIFVRIVQKRQRTIGIASGSYRRNQATSMVQRMFEHIGRQKEITVPLVIATISAAEMNGVPFIATEALDGRTVAAAAAVRKVAYDDNFICRETWMQLQDILTGQIDRHGNNIILTKDGPVAIDHDLSFPTNPPRNFADKVPWSLVFLFQKPQSQSIERAVDGKSPRNYCMPPVIDEDMYKVIMAIDLPRLETTYQECGLTRPEIGAAMARAHGLKVAARQLKTDGRVIKLDQWSLPHTQYLCNEQNSYAARHYAGK